MKKNIFFLFFLLCCGSFLRSQSPTMGLLQYGNGDLPGYVLFAPVSYTSTYLIDKCGYKIREWQSAYPAGLSAYLLSDGSLLRAGNVNSTVFNTGGRGGIIEKWDFSGTLTWSYSIADNSQCQHHDICPLPNGNVLALVWEKKTLAAAAAQGRDTSAGAASIWMEKIVEYQPSGTNSANIVWEWQAWDHLIQDFDSTRLNYGVVADHPELFNFNYTNNGNSADWMHLNGLDYDSVHDQILFSSRQLCEVYVIDHSTSTAEAALHSGGTYGKGGDLLYRWGNPEAYGRGSTADRKFFYQHCPRWVPAGYPHAGDITVFNNGFNRPAGNYSSVDRITPPADTARNYTLVNPLPYGPDSAAWSYTDPVPANLYSSNLGGGFCMPNGNFFITDGVGGDLFEADSTKTKLWEYQSPVSSSGPQTQGGATGGMQVFKAVFYPLTFPGFAGQTLTPGAPVELNPYNYSCSMSTGMKEELRGDEFAVYPVPAQHEIFIAQRSGKQATYTICDMRGREVVSVSSAEDKVRMDLAGLESGMYLLRITAGGHAAVKKIAVEQ